MASYQIRHLHCIPCDRAVRARNQIIDGVEQPGYCPICGTELSAISLDMRQVWIEHQEPAGAEILFTFEAAKQYVNLLVDAFDEMYDGDMAKVAEALMDRVPEVAGAWLADDQLHIRFTTDFPIKSIGLRRRHDV